MIIVFIHHHEALLLLKATWKTPIICVILCQCLGAALCMVTLYPHHEHITAQSAQELGILEGQRGSRFIHSRRGSKYFISWLCGFVASIRVSLSEGCRPCYPVALLVAPAGTLEMSVIWKKGT